MDTEAQDRGLAEKRAQRKRLFVNTTVYLTYGLPRSRIEHRVGYISVDLYQVCQVGYRSGKLEFMLVATHTGFVTLNKAVRHSLPELSVDLCLSIFVPISGSL